MLYFVLIVLVVFMVASTATIFRLKERLEAEADMNDKLDLALEEHLDHVNRMTDRITDEGDEQAIDVSNHEREQAEIIRDLRRELADAYASLEMAIAEYDRLRDPSTLVSPKKEE